jgi:hypothetical protein
MCDQGHDVVFNSRGCKEMDEHIENTIVKAIIT